VIGSVGSGQVSLDFDRSSLIPFWHSTHRTILVSGSQSVPLITTSTRGVAHAIPVARTPAETVCGQLPGSAPSRPSRHLSRRQTFGGAGEIAPSARVLLASGVVGRHAYWTFPPSALSTKGVGQNRHQRGRTEISSLALCGRTAEGGTRDCASGVGTAPAVSPPGGIDDDDGRGPRLDGRHRGRIRGRQVTMYPGIGAPEGITTGPDEALWFTNIGVYNFAVGRISVSGTVTIHTG
jgi:hypothetical protein